MSHSEKGLTAAEVRLAYNFDPETGIFTRRLGGTGGKIGEKAGFLSKQGYTNLTYKGRYFSAHRIAWLHYYGDSPSGSIDHINGIKKDNRICNLRSVDQKTNSQNVASLRVNTSSGYTGVRKLNKRWQATIRADNKNIVLESMTRQNKRMKFILMRKPYFIQVHL